MSNITLSEYVGFIFSEITRARDQADRVAKELALQYAKDDILKFFSVPRFKIPEMDLTIPVLISGAKFVAILEFVLKKEEFRNLLMTKISNCIRIILIQKRGFIRDIKLINDPEMKKPIFIRPIIIKPIRGRGEFSDQPLRADSIDPIIDEFYELLLNNTDPEDPESIIQVKWAEIFYKKLEENSLMDEYKRQNPSNELFRKTLKEIQDAVVAGTQVSQTKMANLLVNPETQLVKDGSSDSTVFTIKAKIMEEGIFVKTIIDEATNREKNIVEFE
ncbi:hypothetical protein [Siphonobacter sp. SORGH_AS_1065]|uniref:hypothetical protein n=1 Tax=Siphonobacter sp. SORGH_AS_1065 TaxID=3041795 RepID=UPI002784D0F6|nr:hypothetical protein [Siphonobacter sp. SORGH_AS_1065]MDQ1087509.1 hypothetical protein [Siphonobacter sp. SORGH_AS_1065]